MLSRWTEKVQWLPQVDRDDIKEDNPHFNGGHVKKWVHQPHPEVTQLCYLHLRSQENSRPFYNYLDTKMNTRLAESSTDSTTLVCDQDRQFGIQMIFHLHQKKGYKMDTLYMAANIFDRYLERIGHCNFNKEKVPLLSCASVLLAAKLEEPLSPCFLRMIKQFSPDLQSLLSREQLVDLEQDICRTLSFDFTFPGPIHFLLRFLRLVDQDRDPKLFQICTNICKFQLNEARFLNYKPSHIAACAVIIGINIRLKASRDKEGNTLDDFLLSMWNNAQVVQVSGISIEMIREPLYLLTMFIMECLTPNRLEGVNIETIKNTDSYEKHNDL